VSFQAVGYWPQLRNPLSFNEKIMNRKLFTDERIFATLSDKWAVRDYVTDRVGSDVLNQVHHVTDDPGTMPFEALPDRFVIKATHGSGLNVIVDDKQQADIDSIESRCENLLATEYGSDIKEYWCDEIEPRIIVEEFIGSVEDGVPLDFKFYVFHGSVECVYVDHGRFTPNHTRRFYDRRWNPQDFTKKFPLGPVIDEPHDLDDMIAIAEALGDGFGFVRVDLYNPQKGEVLFGEITLAPGSGHTGFEPVERDFDLGSYW
jgi:hypothetical protein